MHSCFAIVLLVLVCLTPARLALAQIPVSPSLLEDASRGSVRVLIRLQTPTLPEARFRGPVAIADQRQRIATAQERVSAALGEAMSVRRFRSLPWMAASITPAQLAMLRQHASVAAIQKDVLMKPALAQSVPFIGAPIFWQVGYRGTGWTVAVLDTGVDSAHPMLAGRVVHEACFSTNSVEDSATSLCAGGATTGEGSGSAPPCSSSIDGCEHGTVIAGVAAGRSTGLSGVAPDATVTAIQVYSRIDDVALCQGLTTPCALSFTSDQIAGLEHVLEMAGPANEARIAAANLSLSGDLFTSTCDAAEGMPAFKDAVDNLRAIGIPTIVASGNNGATGAVAAPACVSTAVSIGATVGDLDVMSGFTNRASFLSLLAPGESITSSIPGGGLSTYSGTSMSAAFVSGGWALLKQLIPNASVTTLLGVLRTTGASVPDSTMLTYPRIRLVEAALSATGGTAVVPGVPSNPQVLTNGNFATFSWEAPTTGNGPTRYLVIAGSVPGGSDIGAFDVGLSTSISATIGAGSYHLRVRAENPAGAGPATADQSFTIEPPAPPGPPSSFASQVADSTVTLTWQVPASGGAPTSYVIEAGTALGLANLAVFDTRSPATSLVVNGVPSGTYFLRIRAKNAAGGSIPSNELTIVVP
jgi:subtilisin